MAWALGMWALLIAGLDLAQRRVPNVLLLAVVLPAAAILAVRGQGLLDAGSVTSIVGALAALVLLLPAYAAGWLGAGDVKLGASMGLLLGAAGLTVCLVLAAIVLGAMSATVLLAGRATAHPARTLPAAPALAAGFLAALSLGAVG